MVSDFGLRKYDYSEICIGRIFENEYKLIFICKIFSGVIEMYLTYVGRISDLAG